MLDTLALELHLAGKEGLAEFPSDGLAIAWGPTLGALVTRAGLTPAALSSSMSGLLHGPALSFLLLCQELCSSGFQGRAWGSVAKCSLACQGAVTKGGSPGGQKV